MNIIENIENKVCRSGLYVTRHTNCKAGYMDRIFKEMDNMEIDKAWQQTNDQKISE